MDFGKRSRLLSIKDKVKTVIETSKDVPNLWEGKTLKGKTP
jgi:hypothetical protein